MAQSVLVCAAFSSPCGEIMTKPCRLSSSRENYELTLETRGFAGGHMESMITLTNVHRGKQGKCSNHHDDSLVIHCCSWHSQPNVVALNLELIQGEGMYWRIVLIRKHFLISLTVSPIQWARVKIQANATSNPDKRLL
jgi:hypothetical protein